MAPGAEKGHHRLSLLWPAGGPEKADRPLSSETIHDLALEALVTGMCPYSPHQDAIRAVVYQLCQDPAVLSYRQAILADLLHQPVLAAAFESLLPLLDELMLFTHPRFANETALHQVIQRAGELRLLVDCVHHLSEAFSMVASYEQGQEEQAEVATEDGRYSYRVVLGPPLGRSYADRIAARYGISLAQLVALLRRRQVLDEKQ